MGSGVVGDGACGDCMEPVRAGRARRCGAAGRSETLAGRPVRSLEPAPARAGRHRDERRGGAGGRAGPQRTAHGPAGTPGGHDRRRRHADGGRPARQLRGADPARRPPILPRWRCRPDRGCGGQRHALRRTPHPFLVEPFRGIGGQAGGDRPCRRLRIRRDPPACPGAFPRPAAGGRASSGDAAIP